MQHQLHGKIPHHLFWRGESGTLRVKAVLRGGRATGYMVGVRERSTLHFGQHALLIQGGLQKPSVAVKLHQVKDLHRQREEERSWDLIKKFTFRSD